jgi:hypothetical protein
MNIFGMKNLIFGFAIFCLCNPPLFAQTRITNEEYAVYASVLRHINRENLKEDKIKYSFVILNEILKPNIVGNSQSSKIKGLIKDFKLKNGNPTKLRNLIPVNFIYQIIGKNEIDEFLKIGNQYLEKIEAEYKTRNVEIGFGKSEIIWKPFYEKYPKSDGYYKFSRVGFSTDKRFAMVNIERESGSSGESAEYILSKVKGKWQFYSGSGTIWME